MMSRTLLEILTDYYLSDPSGNGKLTKLVIEALKRKSVEERRVLNENPDKFINALEGALKMNAYHTDRIDIQLEDN